MLGAGAACGPCVLGVAAWPRTACWKALGVPVCCSGALRGRRCECWGLWLLLQSGVGLDGLVARLGFGWGLSAWPRTSSDGCRCFCFAALVAGVRRSLCLRLCIAAWRRLSVGVGIPGGAELRSSMYSISGAFAFGVGRPPQASLGLGDFRSWGWGGAGGHCRRLLGDIAWVGLVESW